MAILEMTASVIGRSSNFFPNSISSSPRWHLFMEHSWWIVIGHNKVWLEINAFCWTLCSFRYYCEFLAAILAEYCLKKMITSESFRKISIAPSAWFVHGTFGRNLRAISLNSFWTVDLATLMHVAHHRWITSINNVKENGSSRGP